MKVKKILYVGSRHEKNQGNVEESLNFRSFYKTFVQLGFNSDFVCFKSDSELSIDYELKNKVIEFNPDLIFFIIQKNQVSKELLLKLKKKYFLINFFGDDDWRFDSYSKNYAKYFNLCLTNMLIDTEKYNEIGVFDTYHFQWGGNELKNHLNSNEYEYDVSFIGSYSPYREWIINSLRLKGIEVNCFGVGWGTKILSEADFEYIIQKSKINLNLSNSVSFDIRFLLNYPKNIFRLILNYLFKNVKVGSEIKARIFEITSFNGFLITEYVPRMESYFNLKEDITCFTEIEDLYKLINYYLKNDEIREIKKSKGHKKSINEHLYKHRIRKLIDHIENEY